MFFTNKGKVYKLKVMDIPESSRTAKGTAIVNFLNITQEEKVEEFITASNDIFNDKNCCVVLATTQGKVSFWCDQSLLMSRYTRESISKPLSDLTSPESDINSPPKLINTSLHRDRGLRVLVTRVSLKMLTCSCHRFLAGT